MSAYGFLPGVSLGCLGMASQRQPQREAWLLFGGERSGVGLGGNTAGRSHATQWKALGRTGKGSPSIGESIPLLRRLRKWPTRFWRRSVCLVMDEHVDAHGTKN